MKLEALRKQLPSRPAPKPITPSLDRLWELIEEKHVNPRQKLVDLGWTSPAGETLTWDFWQSQAPHWIEPKRR